MYFKQLLTYAFTLMLGMYIGSGKCIDRLLDSRPNTLESKIQAYSAESQIKTERGVQYGIEPYNIR